MQTGTLATVDMVIVIGFLLLVTVVGFVMSKAASEGVDDYFLGGNKIPWWVLGISTSTSNFDMAGTMIIVAVVFGLGLSGFLVEIRGGVGLSLAFLLVFLGKWLRRSRVMTSAEWMKLRFGTAKQGKAAHMLSAIANVTLSLGMIIYFSKGAGKFLVHFMPSTGTGYDEVIYTAIMVLIGLMYTLMSGLYGVVFTDVIQMILLTFTAIYISVKAFNIRDQVTLPDNFLDISLATPEGLGQSLLAKDPGAWEPILGMFGVVVMMWLARTVMEGMGGVGGYTDQRFFAARSEREASLLTLEAIILSAFRWTMVAGLVLLGYQLVQAGGPGAASIASDPENVLPVVLSHVLPTGIKGLVMAGLIAAAMSTFDSTLNAGASYIVKDLYESYVNPEATGDQLMRVSRWATAALCVAGVALAAVVPNINQIWGLITMGIGAGMFVPLFLRWYWPRFNGYGFAAGTGAGLVTALIVNTGLSWPLYFAFPTVVGSAFVFAVVATLISAPTSEDTLVRFYLQINPWGFWGKIAQRARDRGELSAEASSARLWEKINDVIAVFFAVPFQVCMLLGAMSLIFHDWGGVLGFGAGTAFSAMGLYFFWWRNLKSEADCKADDAHWASKGRY